MYNFCLECNRPIYDKKSRKRGYGKVCWSKLPLKDRLGDYVDGIKDEALKKKIMERMNG